MPISDEDTQRRLFILPALDGSGFGLQASRDRLVHKQAMTEFAAAQHDVVTEIIDGAHFLLQTRADECASALRSRFHNAG